MHQPTMIVWTLLLSVGLLGGFMASAPARADTAADVAKAAGLLNRAEANLESVNASIGTRTSPPAGAAGKLAASRLAQAYGDLEPAGALIKDLPADGEGVAAVTARFTAAATLYNRLNGIVTGQAAVDPGAAPADGEIKLTYPHDENFKKVLFNLRDLESKVQQLNAVREQFSAVADPLTINFRDAQRALGQVVAARERQGYVQKGLEAIPANGQGVAAAKERLVLADADVGVAEVTLTRINAQIQQALAAVPVADLRADRALLGQLNNDYRNESAYLYDTPRFIELVNQRPEAQNQLVQIAQKYRLAVMQQTPEGKAIEEVGNATIGALREFDGIVEAQKQTLPDEIRKHLEEAAGYAKQAVEDGKPGWFTGGIPQQMDFADQKITLLEALDPDAGALMRAEYINQQQTQAAQAESLKELIIAANEPPSDRYAGDDREAAVAVAVSGWQVQQPDAEILEVRVPGEAWRRETKWVLWRGEASFYDKSTLQVRLLVADPANPDVVIDRAVNVRKDHQAGDTMIGIPLDDFELTPLTPSDYILREKL